MKKSSIAAISVMATMGGLLLAIGMCMCLLPAWHAFTPGVILALLGAVVLLAIWPVYRKAAGKGAVHFTGGQTAAVLLGLTGAVVFGIGLVNCLQAVTAAGLAVGIAGIILLLAAAAVWRRAAGKKAIAFHGRTVLAYAIGVAGVLVLGVGMCMTMVWGAAYLVPGVIVGCAGLLICVLNMTLRLIKGAQVSDSRRG